MGRTWPTRAAKQVAAILMLLTCASALALLLHRKPAGEAPNPTGGLTAPGTDFDEDGQPDEIARDDHGIQVRTAHGGTLLRLETTPRGRLEARPVSGRPVLFAETGRGEYAAYAYDPSQGTLRALVWPGGSMRGYGVLQQDGTLRQSIVGTAVRERIITLGLEKLNLKAVHTAWQPLSAPPDRPSAMLATAVEAVMLGIPDELPLYFPDVRTATGFYNDWRGRLPAGAVNVANADQVDAGAENGHLVPATVWIAGKDRIAGISGAVQFRTDGQSLQIRQIRMRPVPVKVATWEDAARMVRQAHPASGQLTPVERPFLGVFRFHTEASQFAVNARTGDVSVER